MKYDKFSRRHFLVSSGAFTLSLPYLVSLMPKAHAQNLPNSKFLIYMHSPHGALNEEYWAPRNFPSGVRSQLAMGGSYGNLNYARLMDCVGSNGLTQLWESYITPYLNKMNILEGFDIPCYLGHHKGLLGTYHNADQLAPGVVENVQWDSLDYFLSRSRTFDSSGSHPLNVIPIDSDQSNSFFHNSSGRVRCPMAPNSAHGLFTNLFGSSTGGGGGTTTPTPTASLESMKKKSIIDRVLSSYNGLVNSAYGPGRRISYNDKLVLDEHLSGLRDLEIKISRETTVTPAPAPSCNQIARDPNNASLPTNTWGVYNIANEKVKWEVLSDIIVNAVRCGASRLFTIPLGPANTFSMNDYHEEMFHNHRNSTMQSRILSNYRNVARDTFAVMVKKLNDAQGVNGGSVLDQGLLVWTHESCAVTHDSYNMPVVTAGSAGGFFKTGYHMDFRNTSRQMTGDWGNSIGPEGIHYNRWLANIALSMGVPPSEFERNNKRGYGPWVAAWRVGSGTAHQHQTGDLSRPLPFIVA